MQNNIRFLEISVENYYIERDAKSRHMRYLDQDWVLIQAERGNKNWVPMKEKPNLRTAQKSRPCTDNCL